MTTNRIYLNVKSWVCGYEPWNKRRSLDLKIPNQIAPKTSYQKDGNVRRQQNKPDLDKRSRKSELYKIYWRYTSSHMRIGGK